MLLDIGSWVIGVITPLVHHLSPTRGNFMNTFNTALFAASLALSSAAAFAQDTMKKDEAMMKKSMTMQECKDYMAMDKKDGKKKDAMTMKKDQMCADMMKKDVKTEETRKENGGK